MQDKPLPIDKKFTDQAWADMRNRLDEEMPNGQRRRRLAGWWWAVVLGLVGASAFYFTIVEKKQLPPVGPTTPVAAVEKQAVTPPADVANLPAEAVAETDALPPKTAAIAEKTDWETATQKNQFSTQKAGNPFFTKNDPAPAAAETLVFEKTRIPGLAQVPTPGETGLTSPVTTSIEVANAPAALVFPLPLPLSLVEMAGQPVAPVLGIDLPQRGGPTAKKYGLSAYAHAGVAPASKATSLGAGVLASFRLNNSNFSIETGLGYTYMQQPLTIVAVPADDTTSLGPEGPGVTNVTIGTDEKITAEVVSAEAANGQFRIREGLGLHYLQVPVQATYRYRRLRFSAGAEIGLLLHSSTAFTDGGLLSFGLTKDQDASESLYDQYFGQIIHLRPIEVSAVMGAGYDLSARFGLHLQYRRGLSDILPGNGFDDFNRFFQIGARWVIR